MKIKNKLKEKIAILGLGYVGMPTFLVLSNIKKKNNYCYHVLGIEKNNDEGKRKIDCFKNKVKTIHSSDNEFNKLYNIAFKRKDVEVSSDLKDLKVCKKIIVSINFEIKKNKTYQNLQSLFDQIAKNISKKTLIILQSTLPPGTCHNIILPRFKRNLIKRKIKLNEVYFAYSYERVTPGNNYIKSITSSPRCYSGINEISKKKCKNFLLEILKKKKLLTEFKTITECETAKILENSYRAINIAFIDEWTKISEKLNIDLLSIINGIKKRTTHNNIMLPGLGVGGYCLTKDPSFIKYSSKEILKSQNKFPIISQATKVNKQMTLTSLKFVKSKTNLQNKKIMICGGSYKEDTNDMRYSPSIEFASRLKKMGAKVFLHDPWIKQKEIESKNIFFQKKFNEKFDIIIFTVGHKLFKKIKLHKVKNNCLLFDLNNCLNQSQISSLKNKKNFFILGRYNY
jgi:UDP-N-acetyl-D-glucosamine dehydrogenase